MPDLHTMSDDRIDDLLAVWREYRPAGRVANHARLPERIGGLATSVNELFGWSDKRAKAAASVSKASTSPPSSGGPAGLLCLAEAFGRGELAAGVAQNAAAELDLADDDVMFLVAFCSKDPIHSDPGTAGAIMHLAGMTVRDDALGAKLLRTLAALGRDPTQQFELLRNADARLENGDDDALRAEVWNELAILLVSSGQFNEGYELASSARQLAASAGADRIASMALGNMAWSLMQDRRFSEAKELFEQLAVEQEQAGDFRGLEATRSNLELCRQQL